MPETVVLGHHGRPHHELRGYGADMADKRFTTRVRRRLSLRFGQEKPVRMAFTEDITTDGLFIKTTNLYRPGTEVIIELIMPDEARVTLLGMVRWSKKVPPNMIHLVKKAGMGIKILSFSTGENDFRQFLLGTQTVPGMPSEQPAAPL
jgi:Tfp pilus assembly protein PilZ